MKKQLDLLNTKKPEDYFYPLENPFNSNWKRLEEQGCQISWAWENWLPNGFLTLLVSGVGMGKSTLALRLSASFLTGMNWLDNSPFKGETGYVVWCEAESAQFLHLDRAKRWGLPTERIISPLYDATENFNCCNPVHRQALEDLAMKKEIAFIVIDSLRAAIEGDENNSEIIEQLQYLGGLAQKVQKPILIVHHTRKKGTNDSSNTLDIDSVRGSSAIVQIPRVIIAIDTPDINLPDKRRLRVIKNNLGIPPAPLGINITDHGIEVTPILDLPRYSNQCARAKEFLIRELTNGPLESKVIYERGKEQDLDKQALQRAKSQLGIIAKRNKKGWEWKNPTPM